MAININIDKYSYSKMNVGSLPFHFRIQFSNFANGQKHLLGLFD